jgi:hypothetical protein
MQRLNTKSDKATPNEVSGNGPIGLRGSDIGAKNEVFAAIAGIWIVRIDAALLSPGVAVAGLNVAVAPAGRPEAASETRLLYAPPNLGGYFWGLADPAERPILRHVVWQQHIS